MKKRKRLLSGLACLATVVFIVGIIGYATEMPPTQKETQQVPVASSTTPVTSTETAASVKKKSCLCCAKRSSLLQEKIRKARARMQSSRQAAPKEFVSPQTP